MLTSSRTMQNLLLLIVAAVSAATGAVFIRAVDHARGIRVDVALDGNEIQVWNSTNKTWSACSVILDNRYGLETTSIPVRTLLMLPKRMFGAPDDWEPQRAVVRCTEPKKGDWENRIGPPRF
ncbi:MAG: hypothetical protein RDU83_11520 [bacterium]|nr:hypothetical protein [bacterium]